MERYCILLKGDEEAAKAFCGENAEIVNNRMYQDIRRDLGN